MQTTGKLCEGVVKLIVLEDQMDSKVEMRLVKLKMTMVMWHHGNENIVMFCRGGLGEVRRGDVK